MSHYEENVSTSNTFECMESVPANENPLFYWARKVTALKGADETDLSTSPKIFPLSKQIR